MSDAPSSTLTAECSNCASWRPLPGADPIAGHGTFVAPGGVCMRGLAPPPGEVLCSKYAVSKGFERAIVARLMQDPMVLPVPLRGKAAKEARRRQRKGKA